MSKVSVVIPNYNGEKYIKECMDALCRQSEKDFDVIFVDNGSEDKSIEILRAYSDRLKIKIILLDQNYGFAKAVNSGIKKSTSEYVILLNNDTHVGKKFIAELINAMEEDEKIFSAQALMIQYNDRTLVDSAGDYFCALGVAFSSGKDKKVTRYKETKDVFSACAGAAIYRKRIFEEIGYFPEEFFAYLEDVDTGYRAKLKGYRNVIVPKAKVLHIGSASSGSRYNEFKVKLAARNSIFLMCRNFAWWQWVVNAVPVLLGITIKSMFFMKKKLFKAYISGVFDGIKYKKEAKKDYILTGELEIKKVQKELMYNVLIRSGIR